MTYDFAEIERKKGEIKGEKINDILKNKTVSYDDENNYEEL